MKYEIIVCIPFRVVFHSKSLSFDSYVAKSYFSFFFSKRNYALDNQERKKRKMIEGDTRLTREETARLIYKEDEGAGLVAEVLQFSGCENRKGIYFISRGDPRLNEDTR